jgi:hypothetical protein
LQHLEICEPRINILKKNKKKTPTEYKSHWFNFMIFPKS